MNVCSYVVTDLIENPFKILFHFMICFQKCEFLHVLLLLLHLSVQQHKETLIGIARKFNIMI